MAKTTKTKKKVAKPRALIVWGGWDGHEPKQCADVFAPWLKSKGFNVVVSDSMDIYTNKRKMMNFDVVLPLWTMGNIEGKQERGLMDAVKSGVGLAGWHGGMCDSFRNNVNYQFMTGGQWVSHPGGILKYTVNIIDKKDPTTKGLKDFSITSEQYYMHTDPGNKVLATTTFAGRKGGTPWIKGTVMPVTWKRMWGKGRVAYTSLGHIAKDFEIPEVLEMAKRNILWAARQRITSEYTSK
jgi:type 1 glutamine amidotransferase